MPNYLFLHFSSGVVLPASEYIVVGGTLNKNMETSNTIVRNVVRIVAHSDYDENTFLNDIALLEVNTRDIDIQFIQLVKNASNP